jgi:hypothetical protein
MLAAMHPAPLPALATMPQLSTSMERFRAWWRNGLHDRAPVSLRLRAHRPVAEVVSHHATHRERWFDVEYQLDRFAADIEARDWICLLYTSPSPRDH